MFVCVGYVLLWFVLFYVLLLLFDVYVWYLLFDWCSLLLFLWWIVIVCEVVNWLLFVVGIGGEIVGIWFVCW